MRWAGRFEGGRGLKSIQEVFEGIEAFVKDMEDLGVDVKIAMVGDPLKRELKPGVTLLTVLEMELKEDLETES